MEIGSDFQSCMWHRAWLLICRACFWARLLIGRACHVQRLLVIWGHCCLRVSAGPCLPNGPITQLSPYFTQNPCILLYNALCHSWGHNIPHLNIENTKENLGLKEGDDETSVMFLGRLWGRMLLCSVERRDSLKKVLRCWRISARWSWAIFICLAVVKSTRKKYY